MTLIPHCEDPCEAQAWVLMDYFEDFARQRGSSLEEATFFDFETLLDWVRMNSRRYPDGGTVIFNDTSGITNGGTATIATGEIDGHAMIYPDGAIYLHVLCNGPGVEEFFTIAVAKANILEVIKE